VLLTLNGWSFEVDKKGTSDVSAVELADHCTCDFCNNFYGTVKKYNPNLEAFLKRFGAEIFAPDSMRPYPCKGFVEYALEYKVIGNVLTIGDAPIDVDGLQIVADMDIECFYLCFTMLLPWQLNVPLEHARTADGQIPEPGFWSSANYSS